MDTKKLITNLQRVFRDNQQLGGNKYSEVWLSAVDFGGLYYTDKYYILNIKTRYAVNSSMDEISEVIHLLGEKARDELRHIWRVAVNDAANEFDDSTDNLMIYHKANFC